MSLFLFISFFGLVIWLFCLYYFGKLHFKAKHSVTSALFFMSALITAFQVLIIFHTLDIISRMSGEVQSLFFSAGSVLSLITGLFLLRAVNKVSRIKAGELMICRYCPYKKSN